MKWCENGRNAAVQMQILGGATVAHRDSDPGLVSISLGRFPPHHARICLLPAETPRCGWPAAARIFRTTIEVHSLSRGNLPGTLASSKKPC